MADEDENNNEKVKKFGAHSVAHEISEDLNSKELSENSEYSNAKGFRYVVSCANKKCSTLIYVLKTGTTTTTWFLQSTYCRNISSSIDLTTKNYIATLEKREVCAQLFDPPKCFRICHIYGKRKPM